MYVNPRPIPRARRQEVAATMTDQAVVRWNEALELVTVVMEVR